MSATVDWRDIGSRISERPDDGTDGFDLVWSPERGHTILVCNHNFGTFPDIPNCLDCGSELAHD